MQIAGQLFGWVVATISSVMQNMNVEYEWQVPCNAKTQRMKEK